MRWLLASVVVLAACEPAADGSGKGAGPTAVDQEGSDDNTPGGGDGDGGSGDDGSGDGGPGDDGGSEGDDEEPPIDEDADGFSADADCDDADPSVYPGAAERCDGEDQDCDGVADNGVPNDGAGCQDPGPPAFPSTVGVLHITTRTGDDTYNGTDDGIDVCLSADRCFSVNKPSWDDLERGELDVAVFEDPGLDRAEVTGFAVEGGGTNQWRPTCFSMRLDGEPVYCRDGLELAIGNEGDELESWTEPDPLAAHCTTCFDAPLTHGPYVGAVGPDRARIWLRTDATRQVTLRVASSRGGLDTADPVAFRYPSADADFTEVIDVFGLSADTVHHYDLEVAGERFGPWTFTTAPPLGAASRWRLAFGSCSRDDDQPLFGVVAAAAPDVFLFIGDNHYGNTDDLAALRQFYRWAHSRPLRAEVMAQASVLATWDDHDYTGNNTDGTEAGRDTALRVFAEYWANPSYGTADTSGVFSVVQRGDVDLFLLDDRYWRGLDDSILGDAQEAWLLDGLRASTATFKLLASGSQFTQDGSSDSWAAHPDAWDRLREAIVADSLEGVVLLSGDVHRSEFRVLPGAVGGYDLPELTSSPLANSNSPCPWGEDELWACHDDGDFFISVDVDTTVSDPTLDAAIIDSTGAVRDAWQLRRSELEP
jgi:alkaline phosphatase D